MTGKIAADLAPIGRGRGRADLVPGHPAALVELGHVVGQDLVDRSNSWPLMRALISTGRGYRHDGRRWRTDRVIPQECAPRGAGRPCGGERTPPPSLSQQDGEAEGSRFLEAQEGAGAALTTTGRAGTTRRLGPGKQDGKVQRRVNQRSNPRKRITGSNLVDVGRDAVRANRGLRREATSSRVVFLARSKATGKVCGVPVAMLPGKSWAPPPSSGHLVNVGTLPGLPFLPRGQRGGGQAGRRLLARGGDGAPVVVRGRESRPHGEGGQPVRSLGAGMPGGRR
jgi:hypothetical protein